MIILQHNHIKQSKPMIMPPPIRTASFSSNLKSGRCFSCIQNFRWIIFDLFNILTGEGGNATHPLHTIQHKAFTNQNGMN